MTPTPAPTVSATVVSIGVKTNADMGATTAADTITHNDGPSRSR